MSGCYFAAICNNKLLNFVLFHKCSFSLLILKVSVKPYNKILEKLRCRGSVSYTTQCNGKMSDFQNSKSGLIFFHEPLPIFHSFKQVMKVLRLFVNSGFFSSTLDLLNTNKIQVKWLSVDFRSIPLRLHPDLFIWLLHLIWAWLSICCTYVTPLFSLVMQIKPQHKTVSRKI